VVLDRLEKVPVRDGRRRVIRSGASHRRERRLLRERLEVGRSAREVIERHLIQAHAAGDVPAVERPAVALGEVFHLMTRSDRVKRRAAD
jgi:hypothetical protein